VDWNIVFSDLGLALGQSVGAGGINIFQAALERENVSAVIGAMANQGDVNVLSSPSVVTMNNQVALLSVGTQEVFFTTTTVFNGQGNLAQTVTNPGTVTNGVILSVTPQVSADGWVTMSIQPAITNLAGEAVSPNGDRFPIMDVRATDNVIRVREGETIFIGGLLEDVVSETETKTPFLGDVPILGALFKRTDKRNRKSDLVVMITPTIMNGERVREIMRDNLQRIEMRRRSASGVRRGM
jgi:type II secretory pathway component GspD/PulD (secretin)